MVDSDNHGGTEDELARLRARVDELELAERRHVDEMRDLVQSEARMRAIIDNVPFDPSLKDITGQVEAQQALRYSEGMLKAIIDHAPLVINLKDINGRYILANMAFSGIRNVTSEDLSGLTPHDIMSSDAADDVVLQDRKVLATGEVVEGVTHVQRPDGQIASWTTLKFPVRGSDGEIIAIGSVGMDNTEHLRAEEALRASEERFRAIVDNSPTAIFLKDPEGRFQFFNKRYGEWFGDGPETRIGKTVHEMLPREIADPIAASERRVAVENVTLDWEQDIGFRDGSNHRLKVTKFPVFDGDGKTIGVGTVETDVTEQRRMEDQLRQAQKMEAVGQLTGGVAHEFNNLLMVIVDNLEMVLDTLTEDGPKKFLNSAMKGAMRGSELTRQLLAFSRKQTLEVGRVNADKLVLGMRDMLQRTLGETIAIETSIETDAASGTEIWPVLADAGQIEGALLNLALNASDAMPQGGTITFTVSNQVLDDRRLANHPGLSPGDFVKLQVSDTGCGMSADVLNRVFEPFFTTKDVGEGTGLGLSMVHGFVEQSGGFVEILSKAGQGTCILIFLPRADDEIIPELDRSGADDAPLGKTADATILVVEDDADVRKLVVMLLLQLGHDTLEAEDSAAALTLLEENPHIDVLFTDIVLPGGTSGIELAETAQRRSPHLKIVYSSGYPDGELPDFFSLKMQPNFIRKPYRKADLAETLEALLGDLPRDRTFFIC